MKPRNLKQAFENDYIVKNIYSKYSKKIRVDLQKRFINTGSKNIFISFWIDRNYFERTYPSIYNKF